MRSTFFGFLFYLRREIFKLVWREQKIQWQFGILFLKPAFLIVGCHFHLLSSQLYMIVIVISIISLYLGSIVKMLGGFECCLGEERMRRPYGFIIH